eukprot:9094922-Alexandrium_andersonii.AAC.1
MSASLVGSEMCIRDRAAAAAATKRLTAPSCARSGQYPAGCWRPFHTRGSCLLYTSDAADDM